MCDGGTACQYPNQTAPVACDDGYFIDTLDWLCRPCPVGHYCADSAVVPVACSAGQYASTIAMAACETCPSGYFSYEAAMACSPVPGGWYLSGDVIEPCPERTYSNYGHSDSSCMTCPDGFLCPPMTAEKTLWANSCPLGSYCEEGQ